MKKAVIRAGFQPIQVRLEGRKQFALSRPDADKFKAAHTSPGVVIEEKAIVPEGLGGVYLVRPEPNLRPKRLKVGWADRFKDRLDTHRGIAPELEVVRLYVTNAKWTESMAILVLGKIGEGVAQEIFDLDDLDGAVAVLDRQFDNIQVTRIAAKEVT